MQVKLLINNPQPQQQHLTTKRSSTLQFNGESATSQLAAAFLDVNFIEEPQHVNTIQPDSHNIVNEELGAWENNNTNEFLQNFTPSRTVLNYNRATFLPPKAKPKVWMIRKQHIAQQQFQQQQSHSHSHSNQQQQLVLSTQQLFYPIQSTSYPQFSLQGEDYFQNQSQSQTRIVLSSTPKVKLNKAMQELQNNIQSQYKQLQILEQKNRLANQKMIKNIDINNNSCLLVQKINDCSESPKKSLPQPLIVMNKSQINFKDQQFKAQQKISEDFSQAPKNEVRSPPNVNGIDIKQIEKNFLKRKINQLQIKDEIKVPQITTLPQDGQLNFTGQEDEILSVDNLMPIKKQLKPPTQPRYNQDLCVKVKVFDNDHLKELESHRSITQQQVDIIAQNNKMYSSTFYKPKVSIKQIASPSNNFDIRIRKIKVASTTSSSNPPIIPSLSVLNQYPPIWQRSHDLEQGSSYNNQFNTRNSMKHQTQSLVIPNSTLVMRSSFYKVNSSGSQNNNYILRKNKNTMLAVTEDKSFSTGIRGSSFLSKQNIFMHQKIIASTIKNQILQDQQQPLGQLKLLQNKLKVNQ